MLATVRAGESGSILRKAWIFCTFVSHPWTRKRRQTVSIQRSVAGQRTRRYLWKPDSVLHCSAPQSWGCLSLYPPASPCFILLVQAMHPPFTEVLAFLWEKSYGLVCWPDMRKGDKYFSTHKTIFLLLFQNRGFHLVLGMALKVLSFSSWIMIGVLNVLTQTNLNHNLIEVNEKVCLCEVWRKDSR